MDGTRLSSRTDTLELLGRTAERDLIRAFLTRAADHGEALLLTGGPGVGKSALLEEACRAAVAAGARVVHAAGVEFEAEVGFAGLSQLFLSLHDEVEALPELHRSALRVTLGEGTGPPAGRLVVSAAALALLRHTARQRPALVVVDDLQWLDRPSVRVLGFVARRLQGSRIGFLSAIRSDTDSFLLHAGLPQHEVPPLDEPAATSLVQDRFPELAATVRRRVVAAAQGNPLALLELPASMTEGQRLGVEPLPAVLPLRGRTQRMFADRIRGLPAVTRRLLLLLALDGTGDLRSLRAACSGDSWLDGLAPAERPGRLVRVDTGANRVAFRHPLIGAAAVELATSGERRRAHAVLADLQAVDPERRAWHLAEAVDGPDEQAADLLELAAQRALREGDAVRAVHGMLRAADLSPRGADRARRLAAAAYLGADAAGQLASVPRLLVQARRADPDASGSLEVTVAAAHHLLYGEGDVDAAHLMLIRAVEDAVARGHPVGAVQEAFHSLMLACHFSGREEAWHSYESALTRLGPGVPPLLAVSSKVYGDPAGLTGTELEQLDTLLATLSSEVDPTRIVRVGIASSYVDRLAACRQSLWRVVRDGRDGGAAASAVNALMMLSHDGFLDGRWEDAVRTAEEGIAWSERLGYTLVSLSGVYCRALVAAARGDEDAARSLTGELVAWAAPRGVRMAEHFASRVHGLVALGRGDYEEAFQHGSSISPPGRLAPHVPVALWVAMDLVEAAVRAGRLAEARAHVAAVQQAEVFRLRPRLALIAAGSAALAASGDEADRLYRQALAVRGVGQFPFERARVQLAYGEHLRRTRALQASRVQLAAAMETFQHLGAQPWIARAAHELRTSGQTHSSPAVYGGSTALTAQEREIASLAASGLSNKQIGTRLHLSPRTVSGHLYRVFPKLGVSTRAALRDALTSAPSALGHPSAEMSSTGSATPPGSGETGRMSDGRRPTVP